MSLIDKIRRVLVVTDPGLTPQFLDDLGVSADDYAQLVSSKPGARARLVAMAEYHGLTAAQIDQHRAVACDIAKTCGQCRHTAACQKWVEGSKDFHVSACPNLGRFADIAAP